jgi:hypothetical protein
VCRRVGERTAALDKAITEAIDAGVLKQFNTQYRQRRLEAKKNGQPFMSYSEAMRRLRAIVADSVASGRKDPKIPRSFVSVFDDPPTDVDR